MVTQLEIANLRKEKAEKEIRDRRNEIKFVTLEYPIEMLVKKYLEGKSEDENEIYIPDYQREMRWDEQTQSKLIESILLGLPIPFIFVADIYSEEEDLARLEVIDGTQRIRTLAKFMNNQLTLNQLEKLPSLNGFTFQDLLLSRRRRFNRYGIRMIQLTDDTAEEVRRDMFERINSGSLQLNEMEKRRGSKPGKFLDVIEELSKNKLFLNLCSFTETEIKKRDPQEFVLRFFAFLNNYQNYDRKKVHEFLDEYLESQNNNYILDIKQTKKEFISVLDFIKQYLPHALHTYVKSRKCYKPTTRIKFESITVGVALVLRQNSNLKPKSISFLDSQEFQEYTKSDASSSQNKVTRRVEYVRDQLLENSN